MTLTGEKGARALRLKRILIIVSITVLALFTVSMVATEVVCGLIFARSDQAAPVRPYSEALAERYPRRQIRFPSRGHELTGYLYAPEDPAGLILIAHGMGGTGDSHLSEALYFVDEGFAVFTFDGTGAGQSEGGSLVGLQQMTLDLLAAIEQLSADPQTARLPLMLYGHSAGGHAAVVTAERCPEVTAVVSVAAFDSPMDMMLNTGKDYAGDAAVLGYPFLYLRNLVTFGPLADRSASEAIERSDAPFLIIHGSADPVVPLSDSILGQKDQIRNRDVTFYLTDGGHSDLWLAPEAAAYARQVNEALDALEKAHGGQVPAEDLQRFRDQIDQELLYRLDPVFMDTVVDFFSSSLPAGQV